MTTYNITGGSTALTDALGVPLQNAVVRLTPHATSDATVVGGTVKLGSIEYAVPSLPDALVVDGGYWDVVIQSTAQVRRTRSLMSSLPAFQTISTTINLTANTTWAAIVTGAVSSMPFTPTLLQQAQDAATAAAASASAASSSASAAAASATASATSVNQAYVALARNPDSLITGAVTRDSNGAATSAAVTWPDGSPGTYAADTVSTAFPGAVDGYHITYGSPVTKTYTQPTITRDATTGAATNVPAITVT